MADIRDGIIYEGATNLQELCRFFGVAKRSDGMYHASDLMLNGNINIQSKHKPVQYDGEDVTSNGIRYGKYTQLTADMRRSVNYGHDYKVYNSAIAAIRAVAEKSNFPYIQPYSWFRPADFWGYDHSSGDWTSSQPTYNTVSKGASLAIQVSGIDEVLALGAFTSRGLNLYGLNFGFLMSQSPFTSNQAQVYFACCTNYAGGVTLADIERLAINTTNMALGTWYIYPVLTTANYSQGVYSLSDKDEGGSWFPLPFCNKATFTVAQSGEDNILEKYIVCDRIETDIRIVDYNNLVFEMSYMTITFSNSGPIDYTLGVSVSIDGVEWGNASWSGYVTVPAGGEGYAHHDYGDKEGGVARFMVGMTPVTVNVQYTLTTENKTYIGNQPFDIYE